MALNAFQKEVQGLAKRLGLKGSREREVYSRPEYQDLLQNFFGEIQLPAGIDPSQIISRSAGALTYRDAQGYEHRLERNMDGSSPDLGRVRESSTNRPAVLPATADPNVSSVQNTITQAIQQLVGGGNLTPNNGEGQFFGLPVGPGNNNQQTGQQTGQGRLNNLSPEDKALLDSITKADLGRVKDLFTTQGGKLVASLFARGMNESTLAGDAVSRLTRDQGDVEARVLADAAAREIQAREFLTQLASGENLEMFKTRTGASVDLMNAILGADTSRSVASGNIGLGNQQLDQQIISDARNFQLEDRKLKLQEQAQSPWRSILSTVASLGAAAIPGIGPALSAGIGGIFGGRGAAGRPPAGGDGGYG